MSVAEHLLVIVSIILGLGLTDLLTSVHRLVHARERVRFDWLPVAWAVHIFVVIVQIWWANFSNIGAEAWTNFFAFAFFLLTPVSFYLLASSVLPDVEAEGVVDMEAHYFRHRTWFFLLSASVIVLIVATDLLEGDPLLHPARILHGVFFLIFVSLAWTKNRLYHAAATLVALALVVLFITLHTLHIG